MSTLTIEREAFHGWDETYRIGNGVIEVRVVADVGPRVVELRRAGGANLFHLRSAELGGRNEPRWRFRGGWRLWIAPERRPETYALDNAPCTVLASAPGMVRIGGPPQPEASIRKTIGLMLDAVHPRVEVVSEITNVGDAPVRYAVWTLAVLRPGGRAFVPLETGPVDALDSTRSLILWSYTRMADPRYRVGDGLVEIDSGAVLRGPARRELAPGRTSDESKIGVDTTAGWAAYALDGTVFVSRARVDAGARADAGATIEIYSSREFIELEHLGVLQTLAPGETAALAEEWWVFGETAVPAWEAGEDVVRGFLERLVERETKPLGTRARSNAG